MRYVFLLKLIKLFIKIIKIIRDKKNREFNNDKNIQIEFITIVKKR